MPSGRDETDPYTREGWWEEEENQFWHNGWYSDKGIKICEDFVKEIKSRGKKFKK